MAATRRIRLQRDHHSVAVYLRAFGSRATATLAEAGTRTERVRSDATTGAVKRALRDITRPR